MKKSDTSIKARKRPDWDEYFLEMVDFVGRRGTCDRGQAGAIIVKDKRILATGYVGSPVGLSHCDEVGHEMHTVIQENGAQSRHCIRTAHAEQNALTQAARIGVSVEGAALYCGMTPCAACAKMLINAGIEKIVCAKRYHAGEESEEMFRQVGITLSFFDGAVQKYENQ